MESAAFVFLMFDEQDAERATSSIEVSRRPETAVCQFNSGVRKHRKSSKTYEPMWRLELWIGPFRSRGDAVQFQQQWNRAPARLFEERVLHGAKLASKHGGVNVFTFHDDGLRKLLEQESN